MKRLITTIAIGACAFASMALTVDELNALPIDRVTSDNAVAVFDAAVATTNYTRIARLVGANKVTLETAVRKTKGVKPYKMCLTALEAKPAVTNYTLIAEAVRAIDFVSPMTESDSISARNIMSHKTFPALAENGKTVIAEVYAKNKLFGAEVYCSVFRDIYKKTFANEASRAYAEVKSLVKSQADARQAAMLWNYAISIKDYSGFASMYDKNLIDQQWWWLYPAPINDSEARVPVVVQCMRDQLAYYKANPSRSNDFKMLRVTKSLDLVVGDTSTTFGAIDYLACSKTKLRAALYCKNTDKVIDLLIDCDMSLDAVDVDEALMAVNGLDPYYKTAEVFKALKVINQRYTLKLYNDHDTWEPILSKVRTMIDIRR